MNILGLWNAHHDLVEVVPADALGIDIARPSLVIIQAGESHDIVAIL